MKAWTRIAACVLVAGCTAGEPAEQRYQEQALQAAYEIGQIQLSCPQATPTITSSQTVGAQAGDLQAGQDRQFIFTADVAGCGASREYLIVCPEGGSGCTPSPR